MVRALAVLLLAVGIGGGARAGTSDDDTVEDATVALEQGDAHWFAGRRGRGARAWRRALRGADGDSPEARAVRIRARVRLLLAGSNWTPLVRAGALNRDSLGCPPREPACQLAFVDVYLFAPEVLGGDLQTARRGAETLAESVPAPSAARLDLLDRIDRGAPAGSGPRRVAALPGAARDGLGQALVEGLDEPWRPGVSTYAAGIVAEPAYGVGLAFAARWPDAFRRRVRVAASGGIATWGGFGALQVDVPTRWSLHLSARGHRARWWDPEALDWAPGSAGRVAVEVGPPLGRGLWARVGPVLRWDADLGDPTHPRAGHGGTAAVGWSGVRATGRSRDGRPAPRRGVSVAAHVEATAPRLAAYDAVVGTAQGMAMTRVWRGELATRSWLQAAWGPDLPTTRTPFLGGPNLLRGAAFGDVQDHVVGLQSVELRHPVWRWLGVAAFADLGATFVSDPAVVPGAGAGIRIVPPPSLGETVRLDVGISTVGWQVYAGWGEAF